MLQLRLGAARRRLNVLCIGAHSDDIEIGCAGTLLRWQTQYDISVTWVVMSAPKERAVEARRSAQTLLRHAASLDIVLGNLEDSLFPAEPRRAKAFLAAVRTSAKPDVILTHRLGDLHQDHRLTAELTWQIWRDHLIMEYEIPKYEGDLGRPNLFVPLPREIARRKVRHLLQHFATQRSRDWFTADTFCGLMRLRGIECRAPSGMAEAFEVQKVVL